MADSRRRTLLVTGGSGRLARAVIERLLERGTDRVITTTRTPEQVQDLERRGVEVRRLDFDDDPGSIAAADAAALLDGSNDCRIYDVGGPQALTTDDVLDVAFELTGRRVRHVRTSDEESLRAFAASGLPPGFPEAAVGFDICARYGYHAIVAPAVRELTGRNPESLQAFLARHLEALREGRARVDL